MPYVYKRGRKLQQKRQRPAGGTAGTNAKRNKYVRAVNTGVRIANAALNGYRTLRRARTATAQPRQEVAPFQQFTKKSYVFGQKKTFAQKMPMMVKANMNKLVFQYRRVKEFDNNGSTPMFQQAFANVNNLPLYVFDLTNRNTGLSSSVPIPFKRMYMDVTGADDGKVKWQNEHNMDANGTVAPGNTWTCVESPGNATVAPTRIATSHEYLDWTSIKLILWGAQQKTCRFEITLFQLTDDELDPDKFNGATNNLHQSFWAGHIKNLTYSPIAQIQNPHLRKMKVLKRLVHTIQPNQSSDGDPDPDSKVVTIFNRWNRLLDYRQRNGGYPSGPFQDTTLTSTAVDVENTMSADYLVATPQKIFMMITCNAYTPAHGTFTNVTDGSFDFIIRKGITASMHP